MKIIGSIAILCISIGCNTSFAASPELGSWMNKGKSESNECLKARKDLANAEDYLDNVSRPSSFELKMLTNAEDDVALHCNVAANSNQ